MKSETLTTQDVSVLYLEGSDTWKGVMISEQLCAVFASHKLNVKYLVIYENRLAQLPENQTIHVCSDVIESIFRIYKNKVSDNHFVGTTTLSLELPLVCINRKQLLDVAQKALKTIKIAHLKQWKNNKNTQNQAIKRIQFLKN